MRSILAVCDLLIETVRDREKSKFHLLLIEILIPAIYIRPHLTKAKLPLGSLKLVQKNCSERLWCLIGDNTAIASYPQTTWVIGLLLKAKYNDRPL
jgi:hypothetical protein